MEKETHKCQVHIYNRAGGDQSVDNEIIFPSNELAAPMVSPCQPSYHHEIADFCQSFHTDVDAGDMLSIYTLGLSKHGGRQHLVSFWSVYNDLAANDPGVIYTLAQPWIYEMRYPYVRTSAVIFSENEIKANTT